MKRRVIIPLIATLLAVLTGAGSAFSQQKEDTDKGSASAAEVQALKARIDQLENQNQAIVRQNEAMMKLLNELKTKLEGPPQASNAAGTSIAGRGEAIPAN